MAAASKTVILGLALVLALVAPAGAQVREAVNGLKSDPVYVDPDAELADQVDADALRARIKSAGAAPMFIAVLPARASTVSAGRALVVLRRAVGRKGTYALAIGNEFRTLSDGFDAAAAGDQARSAHPDDLQDTLLAFIDATGKEQDAAGAGGSGAGALIALLVLVLAIGAGAFLLVTRRRSRGDARDGQSEVGEIDQQSDFVRLGDAIRTLELDVTLGHDNPAARADYDRAVEAYDRANAFNRKGDTPAADHALDEGLAHIANARERLAGRR